MPFDEVPGLSYSVAVANEGNLASAGRVFLTGGGGFVGGAVLRELIARGYAVNALVNRTPPRVSHSNVVAINGSILNPATLSDAMAGCAAVVHLVGIIAERPGEGVTFERVHVEGTAAVVEAARQAGVRRIVHMSAVGARPDAPSRYHQTKWRAEQHVRDSGMDWTIIRPSLIHGPDGEFTQMAMKWARRAAMPFLFMPYFGGGMLGLGRKRLIQPVFVGDVARAFVDAIERRQTIGKVYDLGGHEAMTWPEFYRLIAESVGRSTPAAPIPAWYALALTCVVPGSLLPFNRDQVLMSQEDNTADNAAFIADFGWAPRAVGQTLEESVAARAE